MVVDHVVPWKYTHDDDLENLVSSCHACNAIAYDRVFPTLDKKREYILAKRQSGNDHIAPYDKRYERYTYRVTHSTHSALKDIASKQGIGLNELVRYVLNTFILEYGKNTDMLPVETKIVKLGLPNQDI
jgi:hypothetical protein